MQSSCASCDRRFPGGDSALHAQQPGQLATRFARSGGVCGELTSFIASGNVSLTEGGRMPLNNWHSHACPRASCPLYGRPAAGNIRPRGWAGKGRNIRMLACVSCGQRFSERRGTLFFRAKLSDRKFTSIVEHLAEGCGIRRACKSGGARQHAGPCRSRVRRARRGLTGSALSPGRYHGPHVHGRPPELIGRDIQESSNRSGVTRPRHGTLGTTARTLDRARC
jgi:hypothetical protein